MSNGAPASSAAERLGYLAEFAQMQLDGLSHLILVDAASPVSFFAYPDKASDLVPEGCTVHTLAAPGSDVVSALAALAEAVGAGDAEAPVAAAFRPDRPTGELDAETIAAAIGATLPEGAIVSDEANTSGLLDPGHDRRRAPPRLDDAHRRGDRLRNAGGDRRGRRGAGSTGAQPRGGRLGHVHAAGAVDPGPRRPERDDGDLQQPLLRHPEPRAVPDRSGRTGTEGARHVGPPPSRHRLRALSEGVGVPARKAHQRRRSSPKRSSARSSEEGPSLIEVELPTAF